MTLSPSITDRETVGKYEQLRERVIERDSAGASAVTFDLIQDGRSTTEILSETVRIHAPYTHVPYHQRMDGGFVRFVNNDHALLSARATLSLQDLMPESLRHLPLAQTAWYVPSSLDIWNQLLGKMPGHYGRRTYDPSAHPDGPPTPVVHWEDQEPAALEGGFEEEVERWQRLVEWGRVDEAYRLWLGLWELWGRREELLAHTMFTGLMDVQDRMIWNRSYTTGHKAYRQRSLIELGRAIGWEHADHVIYAAVPDLAVGPRWYSSFEAACQIMLNELEEEAPESTLAATVATGTDRRLFANTTPVSQPEAEALIHAILRGDETHFIEPLIGLLRAGRSPRSILDAIQIASARLLLETRAPHAFTMPHHTMEYCNMVAWFYDQFDHPHRTKLLFVAANFINQASRHIRSTDAMVVMDGGAERAAEGDAAEGVGPALGAADPAPAGVGAAGHGDGRERRLDAGLPGRGPRPRRAGADAGRGGGEARQRPAQPGDRAVHPAGLPAHELADAGHAAAGLGAEHGGGGQVRRPVRVAAPVRGGVRGGDGGGVGRRRRPGGGRSWTTSRWRSCRRWPRIRRGGAGRPRYRVPAA